MVKFISTVFLIASIAVSILASPIEQRDFAQVKHDLQLTSTVVSKLDVEINNFGVGTIDQQKAMSIATDVEQLLKCIDKSTRDVKDTHDVSDTEGREILTEVQEFAPTIFHLLQSIYSQKPAFNPFKGFVISQLDSLHIASVKLGDALTGVAPMSVKADALVLKKRIDDAFTKVIAYYKQ